jgi:hypothetical protein
MIESHNNNNETYKKYRLHSSEEESFGGCVLFCQKKTTDQTIYIDFISPWLVFELTTLVVIIYGADVFVWSRALDIRLQCINGVSSNPVEGRTKI